MPGIIRAEITNEESFDELYIVETKGELKYMPRGVECVRASFGTFERTGNGTLLYSTVVERERDGSIVGNLDSEYLDDLKALKDGRVDVQY